MTSSGVKQSGFKPWAPTLGKFLHKAPNLSFFVGGIRVVSPQLFCLLTATQQSTLKSAGFLKKKKFILLKILKVRNLTRTWLWGLSLIQGVPTGEAGVEGSNSKMTSPLIGLCLGAPRSLSPLILSLLSWPFPSLPSLSHLWLPSPPFSSLVSPLSLLWSLSLPTWQSQGSAYLFLHPHIFRKVPPSVY